MMTLLTTELIQDATNLAMLYVLYKFIVAMLKASKI